MQNIIYENTVIYEKNGSRQKYNTGDRISHDTEEINLVYL